MLNWLLETVDAGVISATIAPDNKIDGYGVPTGNFTVTDVILLLFVILGIVFLIYLMIKLGIFWLNNSDSNNQDKDK